MKLFTAVIRARIDTRIVAEIEWEKNSDRKQVEYFIENAMAFPRAIEAKTFLDGFFRHSIVTVEMKFN